MSHLQSCSTSMSTVLLLIELQCWMFSPKRVLPNFFKDGKLLSETKLQPDKERICRLNCFASARAAIPVSVIVHLETSRSHSNGQFLAIATMLGSLTFLQPSRFRTSRVQPCRFTNDETALSVRFTQSLRLTLTRPPSLLSSNERSPASHTPSSPLSSTC